MYRFNFENISLFFQKSEVVKECLKLLKVLAGNDNVKRDIAATQGIVTIINSVNKHLVRDQPNKYMADLMSTNSEKFVSFSYISFSIHSVQPHHYSRYTAISTLFRMDEDILRERKNFKKHKCQS